MSARRRLALRPKCDEKSAIVTSDVPRRRNEEEVEGRSCRYRDLLHEEEGVE